MCLANNSWIRLFLEASVTHLPKTHSDHCPLLIFLKSYSPFSSQKPLRIESMWCSPPAFIDLVRDSFNSSISLTEAISFFEGNAKTWNEKVFKKIFQKKNKILTRLAGIQRFPNYTHSLFLHSLKSFLQNESSGILKDEQEF